MKFFVTVLEVPPVVVMVVLPFVNEEFDVIPINVDVVALVLEVLPAP